MNNTNIGTSLDDTKDLRKIILENPDLPVVIFAGEESYAGEYSYNLVEISKIEIKEMTYDEEYYIEKEEFRDKIRDKIYDEYDTAESFHNAVNSIMKNTEFVKAIVIYVG